MPRPTTKPFTHSSPHLGHIRGLNHLSPSATPLCYYFGGIPYALPPTGSYRWRQARPLPHTYKYGTKSHPADFTGSCNVCPQPGYRVPPDKSLWDEDCLQLNVWVPVGEAPGGGWPVLFFIHGGWLQFGSPNANSVVDLLGGTECQVIVVCPAYRVNLFGFLGCRELEEEAEGEGETRIGNFGFWDQRAALEWTGKWIGDFGGNAANVTVGGLSAGAHSTFHQLSHDLFLPAHQRIIRRAIMISNGSGMQPKSLPDAQTQFDSFLTTLAIPLSLPAAEKLRRLRSITPSELVAANERLALHEFRSFTDGIFVRKGLFDDIGSGVYAQKMKEADVQLIIGEVCDEHNVYASWRPPQEQSLQALQKRLYAEYPARAVDDLLEKVYCQKGKLPTSKWPNVKNWTPDAFGRVYADLQVHALERGFVRCLIDGGAGDRVFRYRIEWRARCSEVSIPWEWGVTHGTDMAIWLWGNGMGEGLSEEEKVVASEFVRPFWRFLKRVEKGAEKVGFKEMWEAKAEEGQVRRLREDGKVDIWKDERWIEGLKVWDVVTQALRDGWREKAARI